MKKQNGITLISLIITIIIMLILAGVSLSMVMGDGSIIDQANAATEKTRAGEVREQVDLARSANKMIKYSNVGSVKTKEEMVQELHSNNQITDEEKNKLLGENGETEVDTITIADMVIDFSGLGEENIVTHIESATLTETNNGSSTDIVINTSVVKANEEQSLSFVYKIQLMDPYTGEYTTITTLDTVTSTEKNQTFNYTVTSGGWYLATVDIKDASGNLLSTYNINNHEIQAIEGEQYYSFTVACLPAETMVSVVVEEEDENGKKTKKLKKKKIKDLTYKDDLLVWDFDKGCLAIAKPLWLKKSEEIDEVNVLKFSDGTELKTVKQHRIFNKELGKFTYPMSDETPIGTTTFKEDGTEVTLVSKEVVTENVEYYNVITNYHMNAFAEGILTSCRLSNLYEIKDMKYVKDDRELVSIEEFGEIPEEFYKGLRLAEQPKEINRGNSDNHGDSYREYVMNCISNQQV